MKRLFDGLHRGTKGVEVSTIRIAAVLLALCVVQQFVEIVIRTFLHVSNDWSLEVLQLAVLWIALLPIGSLLRSQTHISLEAFYARFPGRLKAASRLFWHFLAITVGISLLVFSAQYVRWLYKSQAAEQSTLGTPHWVFALAMVVGLTLMLPTSIELTIRSVKELRLMVRRE